MHFASRVWRLHVVRLSSRFTYLSSNVQNASEQLVLFIHHPFVNLALRPNLQCLKETVLKIQRVISC